MPLLKNIEIAKKYQVSEPTITNWIRNAENNGIILGISNSGKLKIVDCNKNHKIIEELDYKGKKYINKNPENKYKDLHIWGLNKEEADSLLVNLVKLRNRK
jgi:transposase